MKLPPDNLNHRANKEADLNGSAFDFMLPRHPEPEALGRQVFERQIIPLTLYSL